MAYRFILFLLLVFSATTLRAQIPPPYPIIDDSVLSQDIPDSFVVYVEDEGGKMSLQDVQRANRENRLKPWHGKRDGNDQIKPGQYLWLYYRIKNKTGKKIETGLDSWSNISVFAVIRKNGTIQTDTTGDWVKWSSKKEFKTNNVVPLILESDETIEVYYKAAFIDPRFIKQFKVALVEPNAQARIALREAEIENVSKTDMFLAIFSGSLLFAALLYFFFYYSVREKVFLYFGLCLLCFGLGWSGMIQLYAREHPLSVRYVASVVQFGFLFFLLFFREYLQVSKHLPKWDKVLKVLALVYIAAVVYDHWNVGKQGQGTLIVVTLIIACLVISFFLLKGKMIKEKKFMLYAIIPFLVAFSVLIILIIYSTTLRSADTIFQNRVFRWFAVNFNILLGFTFIWMVISFSRLLFRRFNEQRQKIRDQEIEKEHMRAEQEKERLKLVEQQKKDLEIQVAERTAELKQSLEELKATQSQLVQSEKMASLGEMTAGIAHEIQNPLNFVNNFAEVNTEIAEDIRSEISQLVPDPTKRASLEELLADLTSNQEKIRTHGKRADSIVKNMLQHSRTGVAQKEPVDLNAMVDEYVRLSFHGLRARDKNLNADFEINLDPAIGKVNVLQQDFGRVILNLVNNAFYAVNDKSKTGQEGYRPKIAVTTSAAEDHVTITIKDNGDGIPEKIKDKIFQPFFTTKPTGEGTGLGLSISYDIITKGHNGIMRVESKEGEGSSFIVQIPK
jgi:signal transduction histidine kinase